MGMFTFVIPHKDILPAEYHDLADWQTKDVVEPCMSELEVTKDGKLIHHWHKFEWVENKNAFFGGCLRPIEDYHDILEFHGDMYFYTLQTDNEFIELVARFADGELQSITPPDWESYEKELTK